MVNMELLRRVMNLLDILVVYGQINLLYLELITLMIQQQHHQKVLYRRVEMNMEQQVMLPLVTLVEERIPVLSYQQ